MTVDELKSKTDIPFPFIIVSLQGVGHHPLVHSLGTELRPEEIEMPNIRKQQLHPRRH